MKTYASIPTMPSRMDVLETSVKSIAKQVDKVFVCLNGFDEIPAFLHRIDNVVSHIPYRDFGSIGRFILNSDFGLQKGDLIFYCDDDLVYPPDYAHKMVDGFKKYGGIVSIHGRKLKRDRPLEGWGRQFWDVVYPCLDFQDKDEQVDICGTGVALLEVGDFNPTVNDFKNLNYDDVEFSILAKRNGMKITCLAHKQDWIQYLQPSGPTIWEMTAKVFHRPLVDLVNQARMWEGSL